jgi:hypothetical protein
LIGTRRRKLSAGRQALLVAAYLRKGDTYADLAGGFAIGVTTVFRHVQEALDAIAAIAPSLHDAVIAATGKAFVIVDGTLLRIDRIGMATGHDRPHHSGKHKCHGTNVQVIADPAGRLIWASPALPGARHDIGAVREHGILDALHAAEVRGIADNCYRGADPHSRSLNSAAASIPIPGAASRCRTTSARSTPRTPACAARVNAQTPTSRAGRSSASSAAAPTALPT